MNKLTIDELSKLYPVDKMDGDTAVALFTVMIDDMIKNHDIENLKRYNKMFKDELKRRENNKNKE